MKNNPTVVMKEALLLYDTDAEFHAKVSRAVAVMSAAVKMEANLQMPSHDTTTALVAVMVALYLEANGELEED